MTILNVQESLFGKLPYIERLICHLLIYTAVSTKVGPQKCKNVRDNADWYCGL